MLKDSGRITFIDQRFSSNVENVQYENHLFNRLVAHKIEFKKVSFKYCIFDSAYLRYCTFEDCDFTGSKFLDSNLAGSSFNECTFDYVTFERTYVDNDILESRLPERENLRFKFSRSLRMNYKELGDAQSANKAIGIELQATEEHFKNTWSSNKRYYREKYRGFSRIKAFLEWGEFKVLDLIWGNGESTLKLFRFSMIVMLIITLVDVIKSGKHNQVSEYVEVFFKSPQILLGTEKPFFSQSWYVTSILFIRLVLFGFFMSIIIKRFNRR